MDFIAQQYIFFCLCSSTTTELAAQSPHRQFLPHSSVGLVCGHTSWVLRLVVGSCEDAGHGGSLIWDLRRISEAHVVVGSTVFCSSGSIRLWTSVFLLPVSTLLSWVPCHLILSHMVTYFLKACKGELLYSTDVSSCVHICGGDTLLPLLTNRIYCWSEASHRSSLHTGKGLHGDVGGTEGPERHLRRLSQTVVCGGNRRILRNLVSMSGFEFQPCLPQLCDVPNSVNKDRAFLLFKIVKNKLMWS